MSWAKNALTVKHSVSSRPRKTKPQLTYVTFVSDYEYKALKAHLAVPCSSISNVHVQLPYDVIDVIVRETLSHHYAPAMSRDSIRTVCQCVLVSRSFRSIIQPFLFSHVFIDSRKRCLSFLFILLNNKNIQKYVKELYILDKDCCNEKSCPLTSSALPYILNILATHGSLHSLRFRCIDDGLVEYERRHKLPKGSILAIHGGKYRGTGQNNESIDFSPAAAWTSQSIGSLTPVPSIRRRKSIIRRLSDSVSSSKTKEFTTSITKRKEHPLKSLGLGGLESLNVLDFLQTPYCTLNVTSLNQLTVYSMDPRTLAAVSLVADRSSLSLERILVYQPTRLDHWLTGKLIFFFQVYIMTHGRLFFASQELLPARGLDLTILKQLRDFALFLRQPDRLGWNFLTWAAGNRFHKRLESISVIMTAAFTQCLFEANSRNFEHLDAVLLRMVNDQVGPCVVYIYVVEGTHRVMETMIREALPRIDSTGKVKVKILTRGGNYLPSVDFTVYVHDPNCSSDD